MGDSIHVFVMRNSNQINLMLEGEIEIEEGRRTPITDENIIAGMSPNERADFGWSNLEANRQEYARLRTVLDEREWDILGWQSHSSDANDYGSVANHTDAIQLYFETRGNEPSVEIQYYLTTQYREDGHLMRRVSNPEVQDYTRGNLPYTTDMHVLDCLLIAMQLEENYGYPYVPGGAALANLRYDAEWGFDYLDLTYDYFDPSLNPEEPYVPDSRRLYSGFHWRRPEWKIDDHPHNRMNFLTACVHYAYIQKRRAPKHLHSKSHTGRDGCNSKKGRPRNGIGAFTAPQTDRRQ